MTLWALGLTLLAVTEFRLVGPVTVAAFMVARPLVVRVDRDVAPVTVAEFKVASPLVLRMDKDVAPVSRRIQRGEATVCCVENTERKKT